MLRPTRDVRNAGGLDGITGSKVSCERSRARLGHLAREALGEALSMVFIESRQTATSGDRRHHRLRWSRMSRTLSHEEAKAFYDRLGRRQDWQALFEDRAVEDMIEHGRFGRARAVCEFGCGTGRLAQRLLREFLPHDSSYVGLDLSDQMVALARHRLNPWKERASVLQTDGTPHVPSSDGRFDRFVACYVLDLLSGQDIRDLLSEAHRVLAPEGWLCLVSLTRGESTASKILISLWRRLHAWRPALVGGCRPLDLRARLPGAAWQLRHRSVITRLGVSSEVVVAARISSDGPSR